MKSTQIVLLFCLCFPLVAFADDMVKPTSARVTDVTLRIDSRIYPVKKGESPEIDPVLNRANLIAIQQFILKQGKTQTYCNMYNNNPAYPVGKYHFYLNPDTDQGNINCDPKLSDFHTLVIQNWEGGVQDRSIVFKDKNNIYIRVSWPQDELNVKTIRDLTKEVLKVILDEMKRIEKEAKKKGPENHSDDGISEGL